jgi:hypothetical protein
MTERLVPFGIEHDPRSGRILCGLPQLRRLRGTAPAPSDCYKTSPL